MNIIIIGGGFSGLQALTKLKSVSANPNHKVTLIDRKDYACMIPAAPDVAGGRIDPEILVEDLKNLIPVGVKFARCNVQHLDLENKKINTDKDDYSYDYLVIASGSDPNFHGFDQHLEKVFPLTGLKHAEKIKREFDVYLEQKDNPKVVISGTGYTALELAGNLKVAAQRKNRKIHLTLVEMSDQILPFLSEKQRNRIHRFIKRMGFELMTGDRVIKFDGENVILDSGKEIKGVFLCWTTGAKISIPEIKGDIDQINDGRLKVNSFLQPDGYPEVFVAGDAAAISSNGGYLRRAVNFSYYSGTCAGENIARSLDGRNLKKFKPLDLGWVIPLLDDSVGIVFGKIPIKGKIGLRMHYFMCGFRNFNKSNAREFYKISLKLP